MTDIWHYRPEQREVRDGNGCHVASAVRPEDGPLVAAATRLEQLVAVMSGMLHPYVEDWESGLADGTYEEAEGLEKIQKALAEADELLEETGYNDAARPTAEAIAAAKGTAMEFPDELAKAGAT